MQFLLDDSNLKKYCIIGAGFAGLTMAKSLLDLAIPFEILEQENDIGGMWNPSSSRYRAYNSNYLITSKPLTEFADFPISSTLPDYLSHSQVFDYLRNFAGHFKLYNHVKFNQKVKLAQFTEVEEWIVTLDSGEQKRYAGVIVANGHFDEPQFPNFSGEFLGQTLHSAYYRSPSIFEGKRALIVGSGNTGCDIAIESTHFAAETYLSSRRKYYCMPKYIFNKPVDQIQEALIKLKLPRKLRRNIDQWISRFTNGAFTNLESEKKNQFVGIDQAAYEERMVINSLLPYYISHGKILPKPNIKRLTGHNVEFADDSQERIDIIVFATGYKISFPFLETDFISHEGEIKLYVNIFHKFLDGLFFIGLFWPDSGLWGIMELQGKLISNYISAKNQEPQKSRKFAAILKNSRETTIQLNNFSTSRHSIGVEHIKYIEELRNLLEVLSSNRSITDHSVNN